MLVRIIPKSRRAKNRVSEHGEIMEKVREGTPQCLNMKAMLFKANDGWEGWFTELEIDIEEI
jgi:hypothetical protein